MFFHVIPRNRKSNVKAKTITEIHSDARNNLGLHPGATEIMRYGCNMEVLDGPVYGGIMPDMPGISRCLVLVEVLELNQWQDETDPAGCLQPPLIGKSGPFNLRL